MNRNSVEDKNRNELNMTTGTLMRVRIARFRKKTNCKNKRHQRVACIQILLDTASKECEVRH